MVERGVAFDAITAEGSSPCVNIAWELQDISEPRHISRGGWGGDDDGFPPVVEISEATYIRMQKAFEEFRWAQNELKKLTRDMYPSSCQCGNCPISQK